MQPPPPSQPVPTRPSHLRPNQPQNIAGPSRLGASPMSYGAMTGISFTNGGGFSLEKGHGPGSRSNSYRFTSSGNPGSYGAKFYGDGSNSPNVFSTSITMGEPGSFATSSAAFHLPHAMSSSYRRSYAAAVSGRENLSSSFASMSFQPASLGNSYSRSKVHSLMQTDAELTKEYECCGQKFNGLHALLEHCEDDHPPETDDFVMNNPGFSPVTQAIAMDLDLEQETHSSSPHSSASANTQSGPTYALPTSSKATTPDGELPQPKVTPLSLSDVLASPPTIETISTRRSSNSSSTPPEGSISTPLPSTVTSPVVNLPKVVPARGFLATQPRPVQEQQQKRFDRAFNEVVAGSLEKSTNAEEGLPTIPKAVAPGVLFASAVAGLGIPTTPPVPGATTTTTKEGEESGNSTPGPAIVGGITASATLEPALPQPSPFAPSRPWKCPNPGCNKSYKQSNGLKYHQMKGQCDFAVQESVDSGLSFEEAEERNKPYVCAVGAGCNKRYRQMNGLKYHYLNSGEHGQYGLRMLQNGTHPNPPSVPVVPPPKRYMPIPSNPLQRPTPGAPYAVPSHFNRNPNMRPPNPSGPTNGPSARPGPRLGTWPAKPTVSGIGVGIKTNPRPPALPPIQRGRDAVLFSAVPPEPVDMFGRMK